MKLKVILIRAEGCFKDLKFSFIRVIIIEYVLQYIGCLAVFRVSVYNKCNFRIMCCDVGVAAFRSPLGVPHPSIFLSFFFFFKIGEYPRVFYPQNEKKFLLSA